MPESWEWVRLGIICDYGSCENVSAENIAEDAWILDLEDIEKDTAKVLKVVRKKERPFSSTKHSFTKGQVLYSKLRPYLNKVVVAHEDGYCTSEILPLPFTVEVCPEYVRLFLMSDFFLAYANQCSYGVKMPRLGTTDGRKAPFVLPPLAEQKRIAIVVMQAMEIISTLDDEKESLLATVAAAKLKILSLAIRGKLVPQDQNDEPASVLLERIRAERETLIKEGKIKRGKIESSAFRSCDNSYYGNIPFDIPKSWEWYRLSEMWDLLSGRDLMPSEYSDSDIGIPYITGASNFTTNDLIINRWTACPKVIAQDGDLLITCKGTVGTMLINTQGEMHIARQIMAVRNRIGLNVEFLQIVMASFIVQITSAAKGIIPGITREDLLEMLIPCPPVYEQTLIVKAVYETNVMLDRVAANLS